MDREDQAEIIVEKTVAQIHPLFHVSFIPKQIKAIRAAIRTGLPKKHAIDFRGIIPFFFIRFYFVFLMGRDIRQTTDRSDHRIGGYRIRGTLCLEIGIRN